ncbi:GspH/FimT family pseudopilin [Caldimonas sp. KR1-144]|uniref:GspH/FimT family pseudopilin n=1 Tax=Caldimonas sp. KR1-144 TaxID=3400911 RepID=UPI003BFBEFC3
MMAKPRALIRRGFTMIELLIVVAIIAIVLALAAPSFRDFMAKKRVEGVQSELATDLQYARSEAVARNAKVRITFGTGCYVITAQPDGSSPSSACSQTTDPTLGTGATNVKQVQLQSGAGVSFSPVSSLSWIEFDPVRGIASFSTGAASGAITVTSSVGSWQLRSNVTLVGSMTVCYPIGSTAISGYTQCAS